MEQEMIKVSGRIVSVKYDLISNSIYLKLDVDGKKKAFELKEESILGENVSDNKENNREIMMAFAKSFEKRELPIIIEMTKEQFDKEVEE
jgi:hypothetical protein